MAFDREPFPSEAVQLRDPISRCSSGGPLHGGHGLVVSAEQSRCTGPSAVVVMQQVYVLFGLFP